jgi:3-isopropylmalate dehydratase small subunit
VDKISGKVWKFESNIDTDLLAPAKYLELPLEEVAKHTLESIRPEFASQVAKGDIIIAGENFGCGSSREQAVGVLKELGVGCIVANSVARIFFRNAIAVGLPTLICKNVDEYFNDGDTAQIEIETAVIRNLANNLTITGEPLSAEIIGILKEGGIMEYLQKKVKEGN